MHWVKMVALVATSGAGAAAEAAPVDRFTSLVPFGDSLSDPGNLFALSGQPATPPHFNGRFSNGPVWAEAIAAGFRAAARGLSLAAGGQGGHPAGDARLTFRRPPR